MTQPRPQPDSAPWGAPAPPDEGTVIDCLRIAERALEQVDPDELASPAEYIAYAQAKAVLAVGGQLLNLGQALMAIADELGELTSMLRLPAAPLGEITYGLFCHECETRKRFANEEARDEWASLHRTTAGHGDIVMWQDPIRPRETQIDEAAP